MSSAGATAIAKGMRKGMQDDYKKRAQVYHAYLKQRFGLEIVNHFQLIKYNWIFIPQRYFFTELSDGNLYIKHIRSDNDEKFIVIQKPELLKLKEESAGIWGRINQPSIGRYLRFNNPHLPKGRYIIENLESFNFQEKDQQEQFLKLYQ